MKEYQQIVKLPLEEIEEKIKTSKEELSRMKLAHTINRLENPMKIRQARKAIAQLSTALTYQKKHQSTVQKKKNV